MWLSNPPILLNLTVESSVSGLIGTILLLPPPPDFSFSFLECGVFGGLLPLKILNKNRIDLDYIFIL